MLGCGPGVGTRRSGATTSYKDFIIDKDMADWGELEREQAPE